MIHGFPSRLVAVLALTVLPLSGLIADDSDPWLEALRGQDLDALEALVPQTTDPDRALTDGKTALMVAAQADDERLAKELLAAGATVDARNSNGGTALMYAAIGGALQTGRLLIANGAQVNARARFGWTALMVAAVKGQVEFCRLLLDSGADPNVQDSYGWTALMRAASRDRQSAVATLLDDPRTDPDISQGSGATALHIAAGLGLGPVVDRLLAGGADPTILDAEGRSPRQVAAMQGYTEIERSLGRAQEGTDQQVR